MEIQLAKKPKNPIIIEGFPGFGLVGNISTEFLIEHLNAELIGSIRVEETSPMIAIHEGKVVHPIGVFYNKKNNIIILHVITSAQGIEWQMADVIKKLAKELQAKEIICLEGVVGNEKDSTRSFYYTNKKDSSKRFDEANITQLKEGIVVGVTGALLLEKELPVSSVFVETHSAMPDSKAAAKVIEVLDKYLGLSVDYKPLLKQAEAFEKKLKTIMSQKDSITDQQKKKKLSYIS